jgi:hypothetical protein
LAIAAPFSAPRRRNRVFRVSTTATDILQLGGGSGVFRDEGVLVCGSRYVVFNRCRLCHLRWMRRIVAGKPPARAFDRATVWCCGESGLRERAERQYRKSHFHLVSFAGDITRCISTKAGPRPPIESNAQQESRWRRRLNALAL